MISGIRRYWQIFFFSEHSDIIDNNRFKLDKIEGGV